LSVVFFQVLQHCGLKYSEPSAKYCFIALFQLGLFAAWIIALETRSAAVECISDYATLLTGWIKLKIEVSCLYSCLLWYNTACFPTVTIILL